MKNNILNALESAIKSLPDDGPPREGEFTVYEYMDALQEAGKPVKRPTAYIRLRRMVEAGELSVRSGQYNGTSANIYGPPKQ